jgi:hypothetical protein
MKKAIIAHLPLAKKGVTRSRVSNDTRLNHIEIGRKMSPASEAPVIMLYFLRIIE